MAQTQQYVVEYLVNANVQPAVENLAALTSMMEQFQAKNVAPLRSLSTTMDRAIKAQKAFGKNLGKSLDMSGPIRQLDAFQSMLTTTFRNAHTATAQLLGGDLNALNQTLGRMATQGVKKFDTLNRALTGTGKSTREAAMQAKDLNNAMKAEEQTLRRMKGLFDRIQTAHVGGKWKPSVLKTFTDEERAQLNKIQQRWDKLSSANDINGFVKSFGNAVAAQQGKLDTATKAYNKFRDENLQKGVQAQKAAEGMASTMMPVLSQKEMRQRISTLKSSFKAMDKLIEERKGKPKGIRYTITAIDEATPTINKIKTEMEQLQAMGNISVKVRGAGAAKTFKGYISDIKGGVEGLQASLSNVAGQVSGKKAKTAKAGVPAKITFNADQVKKAAAKLTGITVPATLQLKLAKSRENTKTINELKRGIKPVDLKLNTANARAAFKRFIDHINKFRNQTINLTATASASYTTPKGQPGTTTTQGTRGTRTPTAQRNLATPAGPMQGTRRQMMRASTYPLVGNTSFGVQTPAFVSMAKGMVGMMGIGAAFSIIGDAMRQAVEYQNTMASVKAILEANKKTTGYTPQAFRDMEKNVRRVGMDTKFTAPEVAGAARFMAMAGLSVNQINNSIRPIADVALIGDNDLETTADKITNIQTAFGLGKDPRSMRKLADNLTTTFTRFNTDMMMTAEAMQYAAPVASAAGLGIEDTLAMIGIMGNAGIQSSMAGTTLRMALQNVIKPNKNQRKLWDKLGIQRLNSDGSPRNIVDILTELREKANDAQLMEIVSNLFRTTSMAGVVQIVRNLDQLKAARNDMLLGTDTGISSRLSLEKQNTVAGLWAQVTSAFTEDNVVMFEKFQGALKSMLIDIRDYLKTPEAAENLNNIMELIKSMISAFGVVAKFWMGLYNTFPGAVRTFLQFQLLLTQISMLLNPLVGLFRVVKNLGIAIQSLNAAAGVRMATGMASGLAGGAAGGMAGATVGTGIMAGGGMLASLANKAPVNAFPGQMMAMMRPATVAPMMSGSMAFQSAVMGGLAMNYMPKQPGSFMAAFRNMRAAGSFGAVAGSTGGMFSGLAAGAGGLLGAIFSPIGLTVSAIGVTLGGILYANNYLNEKVEEFKKSVETDNAMARQLSNENALKTRGLLEQVLGKPIAVSPVATNEDGTITGTEKRTLAEMYPSIFNSSGYQLGDRDARQKMYDLLIAPANSVTGFNREDVMGYHRVRGLMGSHKVWNMDPDELRRQAAISQVIQRGMESEQVASIIENMTRTVSEWEKLPVNERNAGYQNLLTQLNRYRIDIPRSKAGLDLMTLGSYEEMSGIDPVNGNVMQYWMGVNRGVENMLKENPLLERVKAVYELSQNVKVYSNEWFTAMGHLLGTMTVALPNEEGLQNLLLTVDNRGRVDWGKLLGENIDKLHLKVTNDVYGHIEVLRGIYDKMRNDPFLSSFADKDFYQNLLQNNIGGIFHLDSSNKLSNRIDQRELDEYNKAHPGAQIGMMQVWEPGSGAAKKVRDWTIKNEAAKANSSITPTATTPKSPGAGVSTNSYKPDQSGYQNHYARTAARPTQIIFNIDKLCNFDKNEFLTADEKQIADVVVPRAVHAVTMALTTAQANLSAMTNNQG